VSREIKEQYYRALWMKRRLQVKNSFYQFFVDAFEIITNGEKFEPNWHIEYLCDELQKEFERWKRGEDKVQDIIINVPPRTLKSSIVSVAFPVWCWINAPSMKIIGTSYSSTLSVDLNVKSRRLIESRWFSDMFGEDIVLTTDQNTKGHFENSKGGFRKATSTGGSVTGTGADMILIDDPLNPMQANSKAAREEANSHFDNTLATRLNHAKVGFFVLIMQRLHQNDLTGYLLGKEPHKWKHICLPAEKSEYIRPVELAAKYVDDLLFPKRLTREVLADFLSRLGSYNFAGQFKQLPADPEGGLIKRAWFKIISWNEFRHILGLLTIDELKLIWDFFIDTAYTAEASNDPTAILTCTEVRNEMFIRNVTTAKLEFPDLVKFIPDYVHGHGYTSRSKIYVEPKASGKSTVQQIKRSTNLNIIESEPPKDDKLTRATAITPAIEAGRVYLIEGPWNEAYLNELCDFPKSKNDDQVDVTVMAVNKKIIKNKTVAPRYNFGNDR